MRSVAVIDYGMGNLRSVLKAWEAAGASSRLVSSPDEICGDDVLVFPGQGAIVDTMRLLKRTGFDGAIRSWIAADKPFFGICLGLQALFEYSEEGGVDCLGIFPGRVERFRVERRFKVPHMGWDDVEFGDCPEMLEGIKKSGDQFYFVHSYCVKCSDESLVFGKSEYGGVSFASAILKGRLFACQFHPEKSQSKGLQLYKNFLGFVAAR